MMELKEMFASQEWKDLIAGMKTAYEKQGIEFGIKNWQEFYDIAFEAGREFERKQQEIKEEKTL